MDLWNVKRTNMDQLWSPLALSFLHWNGLHSWHMQQASYIHQVTCHIPPSRCPLECLHSCNETRRNGTQLYANGNYHMISDITWCVSRLDCELAQENCLHHHLPVRSIGEVAVHQLKNCNSLHGINAQFIVLALLNPPQWRACSTDHNSRPQTKTHAERTRTPRQASKPGENLVEAGRGW